LHLAAQQPAPDLILSNGKIITVDERFHRAAGAIKGDRIGPSAQIPRSCTGGQARAGLTCGTGSHSGDSSITTCTYYGPVATWKWEVRWDGVASRKSSLDMLRARTKAVSQDEWIYNLGGWTIDQLRMTSAPSHAKSWTRSRPITGVAAGVLLRNIF